jgi:hypothetical protein
VARFELAPADIPALPAVGKLAVVTEDLEKSGCTHVKLDLQGCRREKSG